MPELPEVETVRQGLERLVLGKKIAATHHDTAKAFPNAAQEVQEFVIGACITAVERRGKALLLHLSSDYTFLIHLRMTGQLVYRGEVSYGAGHPNDSLIGKLPDKSTRVEWRFDDQTHLFFNDQRKFGYAKLLATPLVTQDRFLATLGVEPLSSAFTFAAFEQLLAASPQRNIKAFLLDQKKIAGIGNIYADESLFLAGIHPQLRIEKISPQQRKRLFDAIPFILNLSLTQGGSSSHTYIHADGKKGTYLSFAHVYSRAGEDCKNCGTPIKRIVVASRGTHYCERCQPR